MRRGRSRGGITNKDKDKDRSGNMREWVLTGRFRKGDGSGARQRERKA